MICSAFRFIALKFRSLFSRRIFISGFVLISKNAKVLAKKGTLQIGERSRLCEHSAVNVNGGKVCTGHHFSLGRNSTIDANCGSIVLGDNVFVNSESHIVSLLSIEIGSNTAIGSNVYIYDSDHEFIFSGDQDWSASVSSPVKIGKNCWIGTGSIILKGTTIGDNVLIGAGSIVKGAIPNGTKFIQKRSNGPKQFR